VAVAVKAVLSVAEFKAAVQDAELAAYRAEGFTVTDADGERPAPDALTKALYDLIKPTLAKNEGERAKNAIGKKALAALAFPNTPGPSHAQWDPDNEVTVKAWANLEATVASQVGSSRRTRVQKLFVSDGLILCNAKIGLNQIDSVYVTDDKDLIMVDYFKPRSAALIRKGEEVASDLNMVADRIPGMRKVLTSKLDTTLKKSQVTARAKLALAAGDDDSE
jgi:hypothetical protein